VTMDANARTGDRIGSFGPQAVRLCISSPVFEGFWGAVTELAIVHMELYVPVVETVAFREPETFRYSQ
jgi:hypothetical protein